MNKKTIILILLATVLSMYCAAQTTGCVVQRQFLYERMGFPSCHASTIAELSNGDLVVAFFGGSYEGCPDVCIWVCRKAVGASNWSSPILAADGVLSDTLRKACYNPVLQVMPGDELWLFFKIGDCVADWSGWVTKSRDGGMTWSPREPLPEGYLGPIKDKPLLLGDRLLCPSSTERNGWRIHFEVLDLLTGKWSKIFPEQDDVDIQCIQPTLLTLSDGSLLALCRTRNGRLASTGSDDGGQTWSEVSLTDLPNNNSGVDAVTLRDGRHVLVHNPVTNSPGLDTGPRTPLVVSVSNDGLSWRTVATLEDDDLGEYSYPAVIEARNGHLYCTYTWHRERIVFSEVVLNAPRKQQ